MRTSLSVIVLMYQQLYSQNTTKSINICIVLNWKVLRLHLVSNSKNELLNIIIIHKGNSQLRQNMTTA